MKGKGTTLPAFSKNGATTFWLASEEEKPKIRGKLKPFGWAVLGDVTEDVEKSFKEIETAHYEEIRLRQEQQEERGQTHGDSLSEKLFPPAVQKAATVTTELWPNATLTWNRGNDGLTATHGGRTAIGKGKEHLSESLQSKLIKSKKPVTGNVSVEIDGNKVEIIKIEPIE
jgi:hypothetical protein